MKLGKKSLLVALFVVMILAIALAIIVYTHRPEPIACAGDVQCDFFACHCIGMPTNCDRCSDGTPCWQKNNAGELCKGYNKLASGMYEYCKLVDAPCDRDEDCLRWVDNGCKKAYCSERECVCEADS
jgi:hypothetical protein